MKFGTLILLVALLATSATGAAQDLSSGNGIVAIVNEAVVTRQELGRYTMQARDLLIRLYGNQPVVLQQKYDEAVRDGLEQLVERQLILHEFDTSGAVLPESVIDERIKELIREKYTDRLTLTKSLQAEGITTDQFREDQRETIIINYMRNRNVSSAILISPAKIEQFYTNNLNRFMLGDQVKLRMIVLKPGLGNTSKELLNRALQIQTVIENGAQFTEMAAVYSDGSEGKTGGDWGWVEETKLRKGLSEVAFSLDGGNLSGVLALAPMQSGHYWIHRYDSNGKIVSARQYTDRDVFVEELTAEALAGQLDQMPEAHEFYLMQVEAKRIARTKSLDEARDEIENDLKIEERARLQKKWVDRLKAKSFVRFF